MNILIGCEFSDTMGESFRRRGHNVITCDFRPTEGDSYHFQGDLMLLLEMVRDGYFDLGIFHPDCTYLCNSGVCWLYKRPGRWELMKEGALFFKGLLEVNIPRICIENPIMHGHAKKIIGRGQDQIVHPWQFGHGETKATCLWLNNLPKLVPTNVVEGREQRLHKLPPSKDRAKLRSITYKGIAEAAAEQWGVL